MNRVVRRDMFDLKRKKEDGDFLDYQFLRR